MNETNANHNFLWFIRGVFLNILGYLAAVFVSATIVIALASLLEQVINPQNVGLGLNGMPLKDMPFVILVGSYYTGLFAAPGFLITLVLAYIRQKGDMLFFCIAGLITAISAHTITHLLDFGFKVPLMLLSLFAGFVGGYVYWYIAGKKLFKFKNLE